MDRGLFCQPEHKCMGSLLGMAVIAIVSILLYLYLVDTGRIGGKKESFYFPGDVRKPVEGLTSERRFDEASLSAVNIGY